MVDGKRLEPRKIPTQKRSKATFDAIVEAGARVLVDEGYEAASTNRIAEVAGVSIGSLYQYFPSKESILLAVVKAHCEDMLGLLRTSVVELAQAPIPEAVRTYVTAMIEAHQMNPALHRAVIQQAMHLGLEHLNEIQESTRLLVRGYLETRRDEILPTDLDAAAFVLVQSVEASVHASLLEGPADVDPDALREEVIALVIRYLLGG